MRETEYLQLISRDARVDQAMYLDVVRWTGQRCVGVLSLIRRVREREYLQLISRDASIKQYWYLDVAR